MGDAALGCGEHHVGTGDGHIISGILPLNQDIIFRTGNSNLTISIDNIALNLDISQRLAFQIVDGNRTAGATGVRNSAIVDNLLQLVVAQNGHSAIFALGGHCLGKASLDGAGIALVQSINFCIQGSSYLCIRIARGSHSGAIVNQHAAGLVHNDIVHLQQQIGVIGDIDGRSALGLQLAAATKIAGSNIHITAGGYQIGNFHIIHAAGILHEQVSTGVQGCQAHVHHSVFDACCFSLIACQGSLADGVTAVLAILSNQGFNL